jgi:hypothetical protein
VSSFSKSNTVRTPFRLGNEYRFSTRDVKTEPYTVAKSTVTADVIDGDTIKVLYPGTVMAKITSGGEAGKIGPYLPDATDGRQTAANIVGVNDTYLPWQLNERDVEVAVTYEGTLRQSWCFEINASDARIALSNATRDLILALPNLALLFK